MGMLVPVVSSSEQPVVSVIVPARNEEACLGACLESLVAQTGITFEIIVVDDGSTDRTRSIAESFSGVTVIEPGPLPPAWTGKNNAVSAGSKAARGEWLLFTDADTIHKPGSLARAVYEASKYQADLLSYSPEQEVHGFWEKAVMPVIFAELARKYPPSKVSDPASPIAAANGQYLLVAHNAYDAVGGHATVASDLLEDVALASAFKRSGRTIHFRFGGDAVRARMYRSFAQLEEGWTKNLVLLFPSVVSLAGVRLVEFVLVVTDLVFWFLVPSKWPLIGVVVAFFFWRRIRRAHFSALSNVVAFFGLPVFVYLLLRSAKQQRKGAVTWKGRKYHSSERCVEESRWSVLVGNSYLAAATVLVMMMFSIGVLLAYHNFLLRNR